MVDKIRCLVVYIMLYTSYVHRYVYMLTIVYIYIYNYIYMQYTYTRLFIYVHVCTVCTYTNIATVQIHTYILHAIIPIHIPIVSQNSWFTLLVKSQSHAPVASTRFRSAEQADLSTSRHWFQSQLRGREGEPAAGDGWRPARAQVFFEDSGQWR